MTDEAYKKPLPLSPADLGERIIDALVPALPNTPHVPPAWSQVWSEVRAVFGPIRGSFFVAGVVLTFPFQLLWMHIPVAKPLMFVAIGVFALWIWDWPGLLVFCLLVWLFKQFGGRSSRQAQ